MLKTSFLKDVKAVAAPPPGKHGFGGAEPKIGYINVGAINAKEKEAMRAEQERLLRIGKGVTKEAQEIFDALSRT